MTNVLRISSALMAGVAGAAVFAGQAEAGGFYPREQSAVFMGSAYAGAAAGSVLSSAFWNPAAYGQFDGINSDSNYTLIMPSSEITATSGTFLAAGAKSGDIGDTAVLPSSFMSYQLNDKIVLGMGVNAPFGLTTDGNFSWAGSVFARESKIATYNFTPTVAYRVSPGVIVGAGLQVEYMDAQLRSALPTAGPAGPTTAVKGDDWGFGFTAGVLVTPHTGTTIGLGLRSKIEHDLEGTFHISGVVPQNQIKADVSLPEILTLSLRQQLAPAWTMLGTVEWTNWSRVPQLQIICKAAGPLPNCPVAGQPMVGGTLPLGWEDGWLFSLGLEHNYSEALTLRAGVGYEKSPIQSAEGRTLRVPDADRVWASIGASYKYSENTSFDISYAHLFIEDATTSQALGPISLAGTVESSADAISVGVRTKLDWLLGAR